MMKNKIKPFAQSCIENQAVILKQLSILCPNTANVLEVGSGTGQHAIYFAKNLPYLTWHTSDREEYHSGIKMWLDEAKLNNVLYPLPLDVSQSTWPDLSIDVIFTANTMHIMSQNDVENFIIGAGDLLKKEGLFIVYGPFNYNAQYTSQSNANFDVWLKKNNPLSGIKNFEFIETLAQGRGMEIIKQIDMPANNKILCFKKN